MQGRFLGLEIDVSTARSAEDIWRRFKTCTRHFWTLRGVLHTLGETSIFQTISNPHQGLAASAKVYELAPQNLTTIRSAF